MEASFKELYSYFHNFFPNILIIHFNTFELNFGTDNFEILELYF